MSRDVLLGVDLVDISRMERPRRDLGRHFRKTLGSGLHAAREAGSTVELAADFSVRESLIKAVGGRFPGMSLNDLRPDDPGTGTGYGEHLLLSVADQMRQTTDFCLSHRGRYLLEGPTAVHAAARMGDPDGARPVGYVGWGERADQLVSIVIVINEPPRKDADS